HLLSHYMDEALLEKKDDEGKTAFMVSILKTRKDISIVNCFLSPRSNRKMLPIVLSQKDTHGRTPLMFAVMNKGANSYLIEAIMGTYTFNWPGGCTHAIKERDNEGNTALLWAVKSSNHRAIAYLLLQYPHHGMASKGNDGAFTEEDNNHKTALMLATEEMRAYLLHEYMDSAYYTKCESVDIPRLSSSPLTFHAQSSSASNSSPIPQETDEQESIKLRH
ncbi:MAG: ankyrin repeat domain-containing protein, partial [Gammaproteobacteria bacterium]|nr:ankyrin repeat domain-containing protein [Gammaproteobacteria bacterium]